MCTFITLILPATLSMERVTEVLVAGRRTFKECPASKSLRRCLRAGDRFGTTTRELCDCGTQLGWMSRDKRAPRPIVTKARIRAMRKKGWSDPRTEAWIEGQKIARRQGELRSTGAGVDQIDQWIAMLRELSALPGAGGLALLLHEYSGALFDEEFPPLARESLRVAELNRERLGSIRWDVLYEFRGR